MAAYRQIAMKRAIIGLLIFIAGFGASCSGADLSLAYLEANRSRLATPAAQEGQPTQFVVAPGSSARSISQNLADLNRTQRSFKRVRCKDYLLHVLIVLDLRFSLKFLCGYAQQVARVAFA